MDAGTDTRETREQRIERRLAEIAGRPDFPAFSENIQRVMRSTQAEDSSIRHITNIILRDYSLALKLLRTANSPLYNRSGRPIHSVTHAVTLLGLEAVRHLAGGLLLFSHYRGASPGLKELMLLSLLSANHAHHASAATGFPRLEEAYICGMYRNLGEVLMAAYFPKDYSRMLVEMLERKSSLRAAALKIAGFTLEELGQACARNWGLPEPVTATIRNWEPVRSLPGSAAQLSNITAFAHGLTTAIYRRDAEVAQSGVRLLVDLYRPVLGLDLEETQRIAELAILDAKETFDAVQMPLDDLRLRSQMRAALAQVSLTPDPLPADAAAPAGQASEELLERLTLEAEHAVAADGAFDLNAALMIVLEAICRGGGFERAAFCLVDPERAYLQARIGLGQDIDALLEQFRYRVSGPGSPIALALSLRQDLFVDNRRDGRFEHTELVRALRPLQFGLLPVVVQDVAIGGLYFDCRAGGVELGDRRRRLLGELRDLAARAILRARSEGGQSAAAD